MRDKKGIAFPKKSLGQNFLRDETIVNRIVDALELRKDETVIEIGPGRGALTERLLTDAGRIAAIEFDRDLISPLRERFDSFDNFELINDDALNIDFADILMTDADNGKTKLVANLPYNISTPILQRLIDRRELFSKIVLMFQREVAERIVAAPGGRKRGFLSVMVENAFETEYLFDDKLINHTVFRNNSISKLVPLYRNIVQTLFDLVTQQTVIIIYFTG